MKQAVTILVAFVRRDWRTALSYRVPFVLELFALLFSLMFFFYLGALFDTTASRQEGLEKGYFAFVVIGIALLGIGQTGIGSFAQQVRQDQTTGTFEALVASATPSWLLILGTAAYDLVRATIGSVITIVLAIALFGLRLESDAFSLLLAAAAILASVIFFTAIGVAVAAVTVMIKQTTGLVGAVIAGLALFSGVWFPIEVLPTPLELLAQASPLTWALEVLRAALLRGEADVTHLAILFPCAIAALPAALLLFDLALRRARREGSLAQY